MKTMTYNQREDVKQGGLVDAVHLEGTGSSILLSWPDPGYMEEYSTRPVEAA